MGGIGSGKYGGRPTVENSLVLDLNQLVHQGIVQPGATSHMDPSSGTRPLAGRDPLASAMRLI
jgi:hypothetical protein